MDQDVPHRISAPSHEADQPRYSLVLKLVFFLRTHAGGAGGQQQQSVHGLIRPEWGDPIRVGSACSRSGQPAWRAAGEVEQREL